MLQENISEIAEEVKGMDQDLFVVTFNRQPGDGRKILKTFNFDNLYPGIGSESVFLNTHLVCCKTGIPYSYFRII